MSRHGKAETLAIAAAVLFSVPFFAFVAYLGWAEATADTISQRIETTGDVKRLRIEAKTDGRIDAMGCQLIDTHTGGVK